GEAISQVASQTLPNLAVIDQVSDLLVLRPLITSSKMDIIDTARRIGTEAFSSSMPEYCGVISVNPAIRTTPAIVAEAEASFDFTILDEAVKNASYTDCSDLELDLEGADAVELVSQARPGQVVVDIRAPDEQELN